MQQQADVFSDALDLGDANDQPHNATDNDRDRRPPQEALLANHHQQPPSQRMFKSASSGSTDAISEHGGSTSSGVDVSHNGSSDNEDSDQHTLSQKLQQPTQKQHGSENSSNSGDTGPPQSASAIDLEQASSLEESLGKTIEILELALNNQFDRALSLAHSKAHQDLYMGLGHAALCFLRASLTLERDDLEAAIKAINNSLVVSSAKRKQMMSRLWWRPNYDLFTDEQVHAELVHAESLLMMALITFLADQSLICLLKGAFRIRSCYQTYKECLYILGARQNWCSPMARRHFESGVRMGLGTFNLLMSYLPGRVLRFLEYVGFSGNRKAGVTQLDRSIELADGLRSVFSALLTLTYHTYIEAMFGLGAFDAGKVREINTQSMQLYPNSAFFLLFRGRYHQFQGEIHLALESFQRCIDAQNEWKQFHAICHWEMMWCYAIKMDWPKAAHYSDLLRRQSKWSPASYTYQYATFLYAQHPGPEQAGQIREGTECQNMEHIVETMRTVPKLRIRYAGKTIPAEKFAITRSEKFLEKNNKLTLPALEFLYIWNIFTTMRHAPHYVKNILDRLELELELLEQQRYGETKQHHLVEDRSLCLLLKCVCLKILNRWPEAEQCLLEIIDNESQIKTDTFLLPYACLEMGLLKLNADDYDDSRRWLQQAKHKYTGYLMETVVHFRIHAANLVIRQNQQEQLETEFDEDEAEEAEEAKKLSEQTLGLDLACPMDKPLASGQSTDEAAILIRE